MMTRIVVIEEDPILADPLLERLSNNSLVELCEYLPWPGSHAQPGTEQGLANRIASQRIHTIIYSPADLTKPFAFPQANATSVLRLCHESQTVKHIIVLSRALVYGASPQNPGLISEGRPVSRKGVNSLADGWCEFERTACELIKVRTDLNLTILRPVPLRLLAPGHGLFRSRLAMTLPGYDPSIQVLSVKDLVGAVCRVVEAGDSGIFNVAPNDVIPLRMAIRVVGGLRVPVPRTLRRFGRSALKLLSHANSISTDDYCRYSWTVSNEKLR